MSRLIDPKDPKTGRYPFVYRNASQTDLAATFARIRREAKAKEDAEAEKPANVRPIKRARPQLEKIR